MNVAVKLAVTGFVMAVAGTGCVVSKADDADRFREPIPGADEVALKVPGGSGSATRTQGLHITTNGPTSSSARYYRFTRDLTSSVDGGTAVILGAIWAVVNTAPTSIDGKTATWGPGQGNALDPVVWRFRVTEVAAGEYDYVLEGQRKGTSDYLAILTGHGYGKSRPEHKTGWFEADNDAMNQLDPDRAHDEGRLKVTYDLKQLPATIAVEVRQGTGKPWADVTVTHETGGAGSVVITGLGDIDDSKATKLEDVALTSRWDTTGAGRADITIAGGDLPATTPKVEATECWSSSFARVYYEDTVSYEPTSGDASACAFAASN